MTEINNCNPDWLKLTIVIQDGRHRASRSSWHCWPRSSWIPYQVSFLTLPNLFRLSMFKFNVQFSGEWIRRRRRQRRAASWSRTRSWVWSLAGWGTSALISTQKMISTKIFLSTTSNWTTLHQYYELIPDQPDNSCWLCYKTLQLKDWNHSPDTQDLTESKS